MNKERRKQLNRSFVLIDEAMDIIQGVMDEEQEAYDNLPESFRNRCPEISNHWKK